MVVPVKLVEWNTEIGRDGFKVAGNCSSSSVGVEADVAG